MRAPRPVGWSEPDGECDLLGNNTKTGLEARRPGLLDTLDVLAGDHQLGALQQRQRGQVLGDGRLGSPMTTSRSALSTVVSCLLISSGDGRVLVVVLQEVARHEERRE